MKSTTRILWSFLFIGSILVLLTWLLIHNMYFDSVKDHTVYCKNCNVVMKDSFCGACGDNIYTVGVYKSLSECTTCKNLEDENYCTECGAIISNPKQISYKDVPSWYRFITDLITFDVIVGVIAAFVLYIERPKSHW